jgi:Caspase domain
MQRRVYSWMQIVAGAALGLLVIPNLNASPALAGHDGGHHGGGHGGGGWGGGGGGVGVGIGVGAILLNEAIRRSQQRQHAQPVGCPPGLIASRRGCVPPRRPPEIAKKKAPEHKKGPEIAKCESPMIWRKGKGCMAPKAPAVAKCEAPFTYSRRAHGCIRPKTETASCEWPMVNAGKGCACARGFESRHGNCFKPPVIVINPPNIIPVGPIPKEPPAIVPAGPGPEGPPQVVPAGPNPKGPPSRAPTPSTPQQAVPQAPAPKIETAAIRCLPQDLYDLVEQTYGKRPGLSPCPAACLPKPVAYSPAELDAAATKYGVNWCESCLQVGGYMPLGAVDRLERLANVTLCVNADMCRLPGVGGGAVERKTEIRTIFKNLPAGIQNDGNFAVVVGNHDYQGDVPDNPDGTSDADAVMALLVDQLGYKKENIIDLRDATLADFERVFGSESNPGGEIAKRIDSKDPGDIFIYVASHGFVKEDDGKQVYLLPVDAKLDDLDKTAYGVQTLYDQLGKTGARTIMLMLEANFAKNLDELINPPNLPELEVEAMPVNPIPGLAVFKASDRDQKAIQDPEYGIGLFTRYLIEGLAGRADEAPLGNGDKRIDTVELYVYTADMVRTAARKSFGLEQKPLLSKIDNLLVGKLTAN